MNMSKVMTKSHVHVLLFLMGAFVAFFHQGVAQESKTGEWQILFNGTDLEGWNMLNSPHKVEVVDGVIKATTIPGQDNGFLCNCNSYGDFILELEIKTDLLLDNSGIQFRSLSLSDYLDGRVHGYQVQIENRPPHVSQWSGGIYEEAGSRGFLYIIEDDPIRQKAYKQNQWNRLRIEAIGATSRVWINDIPVAHIVDNKVLNGLICLQVHGGGHAAERGYQSVYMRNVRIKTDNIKPSPYDEIPVVNLMPNDLSDQEQYQGFELLFDGATTDHWRGIDQETIPATGWRMNDGVITVSGSQNAEPLEKTAIAMSQKQYDAFELKFEFKLHSEEAIPGIAVLYHGQPESEREALFGRLAIDNKIHRARINRDLWKEWNQGVIRVYPDNRIEHWLNGYKILEYIKGADEPMSGHILFDAVGHDSVSYRSIKIRKLN